MLDGITKCGFCGLSLIDEERIVHVCQRKEADYRVEDGAFWYFDGFRWWKHRLPSPAVQRPFKSPEDETAP